MRKPGEVNVAGREDLEGDREVVNHIFLCPRGSCEGDVFEISTKHSYFYLQCLAGDQLLLKLLTGWANLDNAPVQCTTLLASHVRAHTHTHTHTLPCTLSVLVTLQRDKQSV